ncbi:flagellar basal body rod protein FlgB [Chthonobacter rhizosphaerae]|uniref:flagellar basal body rod protein FlgB n=1 Tax=Chthonobacter rhizosphaerae TaxID=2735553 RepID=UPI0015EE6774|nr:flagellar basal body rod protein FlgB [Chthonobacter rhizosphaerae]
MGISDLTVMRAIREKLKFHEQRQTVLADNVANASTPGFRGRDLKAPDFFRVAAAGNPPAGVAPAVTNAAHLPGRVSTAKAFKDEAVAGYEVTPDGNAVVLEEQMMKISQNQMDFQMATSLYQRSVGLLKTAIGKR